MENDFDIGKIESLALAAGEAILAARGNCETITKDDGTPVTKADLAADEIIRDGLAALTPALPAITEETYSGADTSEPPRYWCVDPLDGTKGFINGGRDFTVNIALIENRAPRLGVIYAPAIDTLWSGGDGHAVMHKIAGSKIIGEAKKLCMRSRDTGTPDIVATRAHRTPELDAWIARLNIGGHVSVGSSLKFCMLAEGKADLYPRIGTTMEWDTAAGHAIVNAAGGMVIASDGAPLGYGKPGRRNGAFAAMMRMPRDDIPRAWMPPS